jgi:hypothetical protein
MLGLVLAGLIAFTMTLAKEGIKYNIKSNVIAPVSRLNIYYQNNQVQEPMTRISDFLCTSWTDRRFGHDRYHYAPRYPQTPYSRVYRSRSRCTYGSQRRSFRGFLDLTLADERHTLLYAVIYELGTGREWPDLRAGCRFRL